MDLKTELRKAEVELNEVKDVIRSSASSPVATQADLLRLGRQLTTLQEKQRLLIIAIREQEVAS
jgi:hypothetical protein